MIFCNVLQKVGNNAIAHQLPPQMQATKSDPAIALPERRVEVGNTKIYATEIKQFIQILAANLSDNQKQEMAQILESEAKSLRDSCDRIQWPSPSQQLSLVDLYLCVDQPSILIEPC